MPWEGKTRAETQAWEAIQQTRTVYEDLSREYWRLAHQAVDIGQEGRDGGLALAKSLAKHRELQSAIKDYRNALTRFNEIVADRKLPGS